MRRLILPLALVVALPVSALAQDSIIPLACTLDLRGPVTFGCTRTTVPVPPPPVVTPPPVVVPPPVPIVGWPNEPTWGTVSDQPWTTLLAFGWNKNGTASLSSDATAPFSPPSVLRIVYPVGFVGGSAPSTLWRPLTGGARQVSLGAWVKVSAGWQGHSSYVNKLFFLAPNAGNPVYLCFFGPPGGPYSLDVSLSYNESWLRSNVGTGRLVPGQWARIEWVFDAVAGTSRWWLNGELVGDHSGVPIPPAPWVEAQVSPTWGGIGDVKVAQDEIRFDHIRLHWVP